MEPFITEEFLMIHYVNKVLVCAAFVCVGYNSVYAMETDQNDKLPDSLVSRVVAAKNVIDTVVDTSHVFGAKADAIGQTLSVLGAVTGDVRLSQAGLVLDETGDVLTAKSVGAALNEVEDLIVKVDPKHAEDVKKIGAGVVVGAKAVDDITKGLNNLFGKKKKRK